MEFERRRAKSDQGLSDRAGKEGKWEVFSWNEGVMMWVVRNNRSDCSPGKGRLRLTREAVAVAGDSSHGTGILR